MFLIECVAASHFQLVESVDSMAMVFIGRYANRQSWLTIPVPRIKETEKEIWILPVFLLAVSTQLAALYCCELLDLIAMKAKHLIFSSASATFWIIKTTHNSRWNNRTVRQRSPHFSSSLMLLNSLYHLRCLTSSVHDFVTVIVA